MQAAALVGDTSSTDRDPLTIDVSPRPYSALGRAQPSSSSWWTRCCQSEPAEPARIARISGVQQAVLANHSPPVSCARSFCNKAWSVITWPLSSVSAFLATASTVGFVTTSIIPQYHVAVASCIALGFFGQAVASTIAKRPDAKNAAQICSRFQQHTSLATMMLAGFYSHKLWAIKLNCMLFGMMLNLKVQPKENIDQIQILERSSQAQFVEPASNSCCDTFLSGVKNNLPLIAATSISLALTTTGLVELYTLGQASGPRLFTTSTVCLTFGLKGIGAILGFAAERALEANKDNCLLGNLNSGIAALEGVGMALCYMGNKVIAANFEASFLALPIGFLMGTSSSRMLRVSKLQEIFLAMETPGLRAAAIHRYRCDNTSILLHTLAFVAFETAAALFYVYGDDDTGGYEVFFSLTPFLYAISRFLFSKEQSRNSSIQKIGHLLLQKSPQLISEEINYALSFTANGAIEQSDLNLRIFFIFQSLLMASIEASLFELDDLENNGPKEDQITSERVRQRIAILKRIRGDTKRNHARLDMIIPALASMFQIKL